MTSHFTDDPQNADTALCMTLKRYIVQRQTTVLVSLPEEIETLLAYCIISVFNCFILHVSNVETD